MVICFGEVISEHNRPKRRHPLCLSVHVFNYHVVWKCAAFDFDFLMAPIAYRHIARQRDNFVKKNWHLTFPIVDVWKVMDDLRQSSTAAAVRINRGTHHSFYEVSVLKFAILWFVSLWFVCIRLWFVCSSSVVVCDSCVTRLWFVCSRLHIRL